MEVILGLERSTLEQNEILTDVPLWIAIVLSDRQVWETLSSLHDEHGFGPGYDVILAHDFPVVGDRAILVCPTKPILNFLASGKKSFSFAMISKIAFSMFILDT